MKSGKSLTDLAVELERQQKSKRDFIADTRQLEIHRPNCEHENSSAATHEEWRLRVNGQGYFDMASNTHRQIAQRVGIPQKYYDRMITDAPELLVNNVQHWFENKPERRMVRTLDGNARAFLSDRYRTLDNFDLAEAVLPVLQEADGIQIVSTEITDSRMYIKALFPKLEMEVKKDDPVQSGIVITNSEIGNGALKVEPLVYRLVCLNGMIAADHSMSRHHVGRIADGGESVAEMFRDETLRADDRAFWLKVQDVVRGSLNKVKFEEIVRRMSDSTTNLIDGDPVAAIEVMQKRFGLTDGERSGVLRHLIEGADLSQFGLVNAVTRFSQDVDDYDRATDFERLGGSILELPRHQWQEISQAA